MVKIIALLLLVNLSCVRAKLPDLSSLCLESDSCDMAVKTDGTGAMFTNFKVASKCINCLDANIGDDAATISCKVNGCYIDGTGDYEFAKFSKTSPTDIAEKQICDNPTAKIVEKLAIGCTIEHNSTDSVEIKTVKLKASPKSLLENERLCMVLFFETRQLTGEGEGEGSHNTHKIEFESRQRPDCVDDAGVEKMIVFEFSK